MNSKRPPVPKFNEECPTPKRDLSIAEEISHIIFKKNLNDDVEKMSMKILNVLNLPNSHLHAKALIHYAMKELKYNVKDQEPKVEYLAKCIEIQHNSLLITLCEKMKMDQKAIQISQTLLKQMQPLINKLPKPLQNAMAVKIAIDIIYLNKEGVDVKIIANFAKIRPDQLQISLNRIKPFAFKIIQELFNYYNSHSL